MATLTIQNPITCINPFVEEAVQALKNGFNPYPSVLYDYDGNEVQIDGEYFTLEPDVQAYLEDIDRQLDEKPIREVSVEARTIEIIEPRDSPENEGLSPNDEGYEHNGLIRFA